ncbi:duf1771-domain-containing protein family [Trichomonas vaginalis G3]|uniref:duf1771-domain-containing protein family n=1 Tax=Trichomonas vaginalis (strain ATCC PRA-98 / G3) TaxID=412133 RepID=UPI0021E5BB1F|nr:duf1771-domain-containing protein family [Trichomonas vaginalis G3]KAI5520061.1 duf1771-domain-containing protein family [Trichomonas vaginalis G3]
MTKTWHDLKELVPEAPDDVCRSAIAYAPFDQALAFLRESFQSAPQQEEHKDDENGSLIRKIQENFPMIDEDIAQVILEEANFNIDVALQDCSLMESEFTKILDTYIPQEVIEFIDQTSANDSNQELQNTPDYKLDPDVLRKTQKWDPFKPYIPENEISSTQSQNPPSDQKNSNWNPFFGAMQTTTSQPKFDNQNPLETTLLQDEEIKVTQNTEPQLAHNDTDGFEFEDENPPDAKPASNPYDSYEDLIDFNAKVKPPKVQQQKSADEINNLIQEIQTICPHKTPLEIREALKKTNYSAQRAANLLLEDSSQQTELKRPKQQNRPSKLERRYNERAHNLPEEYRLNRNDEGKRNQGIKQLLEIFPGTDPDFIATILDQSHNDVNGAVVTLSSMNSLPKVDDGDVINRLSTLFFTSSEYEITEALKLAHNDPDKAAEYLLTRRFDAPPPEDIIIGVRPDVSLARAKKALKDNNNDIQKAIKSLGTIGKIRIRRVQPWEDPLRARKSLTIDLHGFKSEEAVEYVSRAIRNSRNSVGSIYFVTGRGIHSKDKLSVLRPLVMRMCRKAGAETFLQKGNPGVVVCRFVPLPK